MFLKKPFPKSLSSFKPKREIGGVQKNEVLVSSVRVQGKRQNHLEGSVCDRDVTLCNYGSWLRDLCKAVVFVSNAQV